MHNMKSGILYPQAFDILKRRAAIQGWADSLEERINGHIIKYSKEKYKVL